MAVDPSVIAALEAAVAAAPDNMALRIHLVDLLLGAQRWREALAQCTTVLLAQPDRAEALLRAASAAGGMGDSARAAAYERLAAALGQPSPAVSAVPPPPVPPSTPLGRHPSEPASHAVPTPVGGPEPGSLDDELNAFLQGVLADDGVDVEKPSVTLADVGGLEDVKRRLNTSFLGPMRNPQLRAMYGKSLRGGLLLYGPPGCGKTFLARAVAGELKAQFFAVGLHDVLDMWLGKSEQNLHAVFETARRNTPCVLFLDEVDALGLKRSHLSHSAGRNVVVQLLSELDSTRNDNEGVFVLGATNQPWDLDPALRRPGRFDRMLLVLPPDEGARAAIVEHHLKGRPTIGIEPKKWARRTDGYSGADLRLVVESAAEAALESSMESGLARAIDGNDMEQALKEVKPSTRPWFEVAKNYALFANEGGTYDDLLAYMRRNKLG